MKDYYKILELEQGASEQDIKNAYRTLAKKFHPDLNPHNNSEAAFIEVNEAYEFLINKDRRAAYHRDRRQKINEEELRRREEIYRQWVEQQQRMARERAHVHAKESFDRFKHSKVYRTAMVVSRIYNYIFAVTGVIMAIGPLVWWFIYEPENPEDKKPLWTMIFPMVIGVLFTIGIYFFLFKYNDED